MSLDSRKENKIIEDTNGRRFQGNFHLRPRCYPSLENKTKLNKGEGILSRKDNDMLQHVCLNDYMQ